MAELTPFEQRIRDMWAAGRFDYDTMRELTELHQQESARQRKRNNNRLQRRKRAAAAARQNKDVV